MKLKQKVASYGSRMQKIGGLWVRAIEELTFQMAHKQNLLFLMRFPCSPTLTEPLWWYIGYKPLTICKVFWQKRYPFLWICLKMKKKKMNKKTPNFPENVVLLSCLYACLILPSEIGSMSGDFLTKLRQNACNGFLFLLFCVFVCFFAKVGLTPPPLRKRSNLYIVLFRILNKWIPWYQSDTKNKQTSIQTRT